MKTENLAKACQSFDFFLDELRNATSDAIKSGDAFAELALLALVRKASDLGQELNRARIAAGIK